VDSEQLKKMLKVIFEGDEKALAEYCEENNIAEENQQKLREKMVNMTPEMERQIRECHKAAMEAFGFEVHNRHYRDLGAAVQNRIAKNKVIINRDKDAMNEQV